MEATALNPAGRGEGQGGFRDRLLMVAPVFPYIPLAEMGIILDQEFTKKKMVRFPTQVPQGRSAAAFPVTAVPILSHSSL